MKRPPAPPIWLTSTQPSGIPPLSDCVGTVLSAPCGVALAALYWNDLLPWLSVCM